MTISRTFDNVELESISQHPSRKKLFFVSSDHAQVAQVVDLSFSSFGNHSEMIDCHAFLSPFVLDGSFPNTK